MPHQHYRQLFEQFRATANELLSSYPVVETPLLALRDSAARGCVAANRLRSRLDYTAPTSPYRLYWVDPTTITDSISWQELTSDWTAVIPNPFRDPNYYFAGRVLDGEWDTERRPFAESVIYRSFQARFQDGRPWPETDLYEQCLAVIDAGGSPWGCESVADLDYRCREIDRLYATVETDGYRSQQEIAAHGDGPLEAARTNRYAQTVDGEIALVVGRDGELLFYDGRNRLAVAKLAGCEAVPVVILARHRQWQTLRDAVASGEKALADLNDELESHPDLVDLAG